MKKASFSTRLQFSYTVALLLAGLSTLRCRLRGGLSTGPVRAAAPRITV